MQFCPECGDRLRVKELYGRERLACVSCDYVFWINPVPVVGSIVVYNGRIVLVRPRGRPIGFWTLPAGFMEVNESAEQAAVREIKEETNLDVEIDRVIATYPISREFKPLIYIAFLAKYTGGELMAGDDAEDVTSLLRDDAKSELKGTVGGRAIEQWLSDERLK